MHNDFTLDSKHRTTPSHELFINFNTYFIALFCHIGSLYFLILHGANWKPTWKRHRSRRAILTYDSRIQFTSLSFKHLFTKKSSIYNWHVVVVAFAICRWLFHHHLLFLSSRWSYVPSLCCIYQYYFYNTYEFVCFIYLKHVVVSIQIAMLFQRCSFRWHCNAK